MTEQDGGGGADRNSPEGLFLRYARARNRGFVIRQSLTLIGALVLALAVAPWLGMLCAGLVLVGDGVEYLVLRRAVQGAGRRAAWAAAGAQALAVATCVGLSWWYIPGAAGGHFALAFLTAAALNAGLGLTHFPEGGRLRLIVLGAAFVVILGGMLTAAVMAGDRAGALGVMAALIQIYATTLFIRVFLRSQTARQAFEAQLLAETAALVHSRAALAETALRAERLALVARKANDHVIFTTQDGRIEWVNEAFCATTGYGFAEAVGQLAGDLLNAPGTSPEALAELGAAYAEVRPCRVEIENRSKHGGSHWMEVSMTPVLDAEGQPEVFIAIERDITAARAHAMELAEAREAAEAAARAKSQFLATMSHEIRTPMNGVIGVAELLSDTRLTREQRDYVATILDSGHALLDIINDILDLSKLEAGKMTLVAEPVRLGDLVRRALEIVQPGARKKGVALLCSLPDLETLHIGDAGRLRQVILNLVGNAVKFTERGAVTVGVTAVAGPGDLDRVEIAIADTGIGIPEARLGQIFDSFAQADSTIARQFGGTGLGLTISRRLVQQMGGDIAVRSEAGKGSVFTVWLPMRRGTAATTAPVALIPPPRTGLRVLLADDNRTNRMIVCKMIGPSVAEVIEAATGVEAVAAHAAARPDLILMDVSMPDMDGREATRQIRAVEAASGWLACPIHALTAFAGADEAAACRASGMDGVLTKPLIRAELFALIAQVAASGFDLARQGGIDRAGKGEPAWSISPPASGTTNGRSTRSSGP